MVISSKNEHKTCLYILVIVIVWQVSHALLSYELDERTWKIVSYNFASDVARKLCVEALRKKSWIGIKGLLRAATMNHMLGKSLASVCLEDFMFDSIASRADFPHRHLGELKQGKVFNLQNLCSIHEALMTSYKYDCKTLLFLILKNGRHI